MALRTTEGEGNLLPEKRLTGPMIWVLAIMVFLTVLATGTGIAVGSAGARIGGDLARRLTVQLVVADPAERDAQARAAEAMLRADPAVGQLQRIPDGQARALVEPWLGRSDVGAAREFIPVPALIDVDLRPGAGVSDMARLRQRLGAVAPSARVDQDSQWVAPVSRLLQSLQWVASGLVLLLAAATAAVVVLAARGALDTHRGTIAVVHLLGATDRQITRLFQRRIAIDALFGGLLGFFAGCGLLVLLGSQAAQVEGPFARAGLTPSPWWALLLFVPVVAVALAALVARLTIMRALRRML